MNFTPTEQVRFSLKPGDVLVTEGSGSQAQVGQSAVWQGELDGVVCFQNTLLRLRPRAGLTDPRYLAWWARHAFASGLFAAVSSGANIFHLSAERLRGLPVPALSLPQQRAVASHLDVETQRIDETIDRKRRLMELGREHLQRRRNDTCWAGVRATAPLMHLADRYRPIMYGIVLPGPDVDDGVPIVKGGDVAAGFGRPLCKTTPDIEAGYARSRLRAGDLVFAIRGGVGDVEIVPSSARGANITQDVARIAPAGRVHAPWLLHVLRSSTFQQAARSRVTGATITGLNIWELKRLRVPDIPTEDQVMRSTELEALETKLESVNDRLGRQISLLQEHRQALITAAVTGQLDVSKGAA